MAVELLLGNPEQDVVIDEIAQFQLADEVRNQVGAHLVEHVQRPLLVPRRLENHLPRGQLDGKIVENDAWDNGRYALVAATLQQEAQREMQKIVVAIRFFNLLVTDALEHAEVKNALRHERLSQANCRFDVFLHFGEYLRPVFEASIEQRWQITGKFSRVVLEHPEPFGQILASLGVGAEGKERLHERLAVKSLITRLVVFLVVAASRLLVFLIELEVEIISVVVGHHGVFLVAIIAIFG